jgi:hypothetical protein
MDVARRRESASRTAFSDAGEPEPLDLLTEEVAVVDDVGLGLSGGVIVIYFSY